MIRFYSMPDFIRSLILLFSLFIVIINIYTVVKGNILKSKRSYKAFNFITLLAGAYLFFVLTCAYLDCHRGFDSYMLPPYFNKPVLPLVVLLVFLLVVSLFFVDHLRRWTRLHITPNSIKEGMDKLPAGLCYHDNAGVPKFINYRMDNLCRFITEEPLFDANEFWSKLTKGKVAYGNTVERRGANPIITIPGGATVSFTKVEREIAGEKMYEIRATDITKQFSLYDELQQSNNELRELNRRLKQYGENVWDITREREILAAKVIIHDMLGKSLLITKRYIEKGDVDISKQELIDLWKANVTVFNGGFEGKQENGSLDELYRAAKIMGIKLTVKGEIPKDNRVLRILMSGARESLTNAVHHAAARELTINLYRFYGYIIIEYTNDGAPPCGTVTEGGGLSSLRESVRGEGGMMEIETAPTFLLRLKIPSKEAY